MDIKKIYECLSDASVLIRSAHEALENGDSINAEVYMKGAVRNIEMARAENQNCGNPILYPSADVSDLEYCGTDYCYLPNCDGSADHKVKP